MERSFRARSTWRRYRECTRWTVSLQKLKDAIDGTDEKFAEPEINIDIYAPGVGNQTVSGVDPRELQPADVQRHIRFQDRQCGQARHDLEVQNANCRGVVVHRQEYVRQSEERPPFRTQPNALTSRECTERENASVTLYKR